MKVLPADATKINPAILLMINVGFLTNQKKLIQIKNTKLQLVNLKKKSGFLGGSGESGPPILVSKSTQHGYLDQDDDNLPGVDKTPHNSSGKSIPVIINPRDNQEAPKPNKSNKHNVKTIKRSNKIVEALQLPTIMNVNPRSVYNKIIEFHTFVEEDGIECVFMSESWERP